MERKLRDMGLKLAADLYAKGVMETLTYLDFPHEHWRSIRTNNILERLNREIRRRTRVVGPGACVRQAKAYRHEGMGDQEIPEHEASLQDGKGKRAEKGTGKGRKERKCSLDLMLGQTVFAKDP